MNQTINNDMPILHMEYDSLEMNNFVDALSKTINTAKTPFTIAIKGEWGVGKTSIMNILHDTLSKDKKKKTIFFNTWQFSQFGINDNIDIVFFQYILDELFPVKRKINKIFSCILYAIYFIIQFLISSNNARLTNTIKELRDLLNRILNKEIKYSYAGITKMRNSFKDIIFEEQKKYGKIIIFIDDLDRIEPQLTLKLLSTLKLFFDIEGCVFVIALDYDAFARSVSLDGNCNKSTDFLDKIIQLKISIPIAQYDFKKYIEKIFNFSGTLHRWYEESTENNLDFYIGIISFSVGQNPRTIKMICNSYVFYKTLYMNATRGSTSENSHTRFYIWESKMLFGLICLKEKYRVIYEELVCMKHSFSKFISQLINVIYLQLSMKNNDLDDKKHDYYKMIISKTTKSKKEKVMLYNFLNIFYESLKIYVGDKENLLSIESKNVCTMMNIIKDSAEYDYNDKNIYDTFILLDYSFIDFVKEVNKKNSHGLSQIKSCVKIKNVDNDYHTISIKFDAYAFSLTLSVFYSRHQVHISLFENEGIYSSYRKIIWEWVNKEFFGFPKAKFHAYNKEFIIFEPVTQAEWHDNIFDINTFFKETTEHLIENFLKNILTKYIYNRPALEQIISIYEQILYRLNNELDFERWNIEYANSEDILKQFYSINIYKKEWNNKFSIFLQPQKSFFQDVIIGVRLQKPHVSFRENKNINLYNNFKNENEQYQIKNSHHWMFYNYAKRLTSGTYYPGINLLYKDKEITGNAFSQHEEREIVDSMVNNIFCYISKETELDDIVKHALY